jgi:Flp pilus assembly protein TadG
MNLCARIRGFWRAEGGAIAAEFGLVISVLIVILMGCFEAGRYILLNQKLDRASSSVADLVAQADGMSASILDDIYQAAVQQSLPFGLADNGRVIVSSIYRADTADAVVQWQCQGGGSFAGGASNVGSEGSSAVLPVNFTVGVGENVVVAEVLYDYEPFIFDYIFEPKVFRHSTFTRPRGSLLINDPGC